MTARQIGITATSFAGAGDRETNAYTDKPIDPSKLGASLPFRFKGTPPQVRVIRGDLGVVAPIVDVGPHFTTDDYWNEIGARPRAESQPGNKAGIDLTPATWSALGVGPDHPEYGLSKFDFEVLE